MLAGTSYVHVLGGVYRLTAQPVANVSIGLRRTESSSLPPRFQIRIRSSSDLTEEEECFLTAHGFQGTQPLRIVIIITFPLSSCWADSYSLASVHCLLPHQCRSRLW
jgi:hypothetical protein